MALKREMKRKRKALDLQRLENIFSAVRQLVPWTYLEAISSLDVFKNEPFIDAEDRCQFCCKIVTDEAHLTTEVHIKAMAIFLAEKIGISVKKINVWLNMKTIEDRVTVYAQRINCQGNNNY